MSTDDATAGPSGDPGTLLEAIARSVQDALIAADADGRIVYWSPGAERVFGWTAAQAVGRPLTMLMPGRLRDAHRSGIARVAGGGEPHVIGGPPVELVGRRADGSEFPIELTLGRWDDPGRGPCFAGVVRDVSERERSRRILTTQYEVAAALAAAQDLESALVQALEALGRGMGWRAGHLWLVDGDGGTLRFRAGWQADPALEPFTQASSRLAFASGEGLPGRVWRAGAPAWVADLAPDTNFPRIELARSAGLVAGVGLPLIADGETRGVAEFFADRYRPEDEELLDAMAALGTQLGQVLLRREAEGALADRERAQRQAALLNDEIVQGLAVAEYRLARGDTDGARAVVGTTLAAAKAIVGDLLGDGPVAAGHLRRTAPLRLAAD